MNIPLLSDTSMLLQGETSSTLFRSGHAFTKKPLNERLFSVLKAMSSF